MIRISLSREFNQPSRVAVKNSFVAEGKETRVNSGTISRLGEWALYVSQANAEGWGNHITVRYNRRQTDSDGHVVMPVIGRRLAKLNYMQVALAQ
jgi:hypothetical protein